VPATGELVLNTNPAGAQIQIDGRGEQDWHTPFTAAGILPGPHTVSFSLQGYANETRIVTVDAGKQAFIAVGLQQQLATASVGSTPAGAEIFVDGSDSGKQTPAKLSLSQGDHNLLLRKLGYMDLATTAHVSGTQYAFSGNLETGSKTTGFGKFKKIFAGDRVPVEVRTKPRGAQVVINGVAEAQASPMKMTLEPGSYDVTLRLDGYKPLHKSVTVEKDTPLQMDEVLEKQ
jgi:hypothetical protein